MVNMNVFYEIVKMYVYIYIYKYVIFDLNVMGINDVFMWVILFCVVGLILSIFLCDVRKDKLCKKKKEEFLLFLVLKEVKEF